jgi:CubicO group peptidase (beta-lactamase class C family)
MCAPAARAEPAPALATAVDRAAAELTVKEHVPGVAIAVVRHGEVIYEHGYGFADVASKTPATVDTRFEIGSITKQFTAACIMQLVRAGKLSLDDPLGKFVTDYPAGSAVTVRQMLSHTSGLPEYLDYEAGHTLATKPVATAGILRRIAKQPLDFAPGSAWAYNNTNYLLLGRIVELTAREPYEKYVREHLFAPANMTQSGFISDERTFPDMATGYERVGAAGVARAQPIAEAWAGGAGAIVSTVGDLAKWNAAVANGSIVAPDDVKLLQTAVTLPDGSRTKYGLGWAVDSLGGHPRVWHSGRSNGFSTTNALFPADDESIIVLGNLAESTPSRAASLIFRVMHPDVDAKFNTAVAGEDEAVTARVRSWLGQIETGKIERAGLSKAFDAFMSHPAVEFAQAEFVPLGPVTGLVFRGTSRRGSTVDYRYNASFGTAQEYIVLSIDARNKIAAFLFKPYDDSPDFTKVKTNPKLTAAAGRVVDWLRQLASGRIDRSRLTRSFSASFTPSLAARAKRAFAPLGELKQLILRRQPAHAGSMVYACEVSFASAKAKVSLAIDATDRIDAFTYTLSR